MSTKNREYQEYLKTQYAETLKTIDQQILLKEEEGIALLDINEVGWKILINSRKNMDKNDYNDIIEDNRHILETGKGFAKVPYIIGKIIYLGYWAGGVNFCSIVQSVGQIFAFILPGIPTYLNAQCSNFIRTDPEIMQFCFWATLPSLVLPLALGALGATFLGFVFPAIVNVFVALWAVIITSPLGILSPMGGENSLSN